MGAHALCATHDPRETTAAACDEFMRRVLDAADPEGVLSEAERPRRPERARSLYLSALAFLSSRALARRAYR